MLQWEVHFYPWRQKDPFRGLYVREWPMKIGSAMKNGCRGRERGGESRNQSELWEVLLEGPCCMLNRFSHVWLSDPMDCSSRLFCPWDSPDRYWSGLPCPPPGDLPDPRIEPASFLSPALAGSFLTASTTWEALYWSEPGRNDEGLI